MRGWRNFTLNGWSFKKFLLVLHKYYHLSHLKSNVCSFYSPTHKIIGRSGRRAAHFINSRARIAPKNSQRANAINYQEQHRSKNRARGMKGRPIELQYKISKIAHTHPAPASERATRSLISHHKQHHRRERESDPQKGGTQESGAFFKNNKRGLFHPSAALSLFRFLGLKRHRICHCRGLVKKNLFCERALVHFFHTKNNTCGI
jgi:hypothetical protein